MSEHCASFFSNRDCEYFPCHPIAAGEPFNCLFCFCPLYSLPCPGEPKLLPDGVRDCSGCGFPHRKENYAAIMECLRAAQERKREAETPR